MISSDLRSDLCHQDEEYDSWNVIADYIFQVIYLCVLLLGD